MIRLSHHRRSLVWLQIVLVLVSSGCTPLQPFFVGGDSQLETYLDHATAIEYPDVDHPMLAEVEHAAKPLMLGNHDYQIWEMTLEECVSIALQNSQALRTIGGVSVERQNISAQVISNNSQQLSSVYDPAIAASRSVPQGLVVDGQGNRVLPRGAAQANQLGGVEDALAEFDAQVSGIFNLNTTDRLRNVGVTSPPNPFTPPKFAARDSIAQLAISKRTATGGVATLRQQTAYSWNNVSTGIPITAGSIARAVPSDWTTLLEAQFEHPLMRNRGVLINRIPVVLASLNEDLAIAEYEGHVRNLVIDIENAYWDLYFAYRQVEAAATGRDSAQATARSAQVRLEGGQSTSQEVAQANGQLAGFEAQLKAALAGANLTGLERTGLFGRERNLRFLMGLAESDGRLIRPKDQPTLAPIQFDWDTARTEAIELSPELRQVGVRIKQLELELMSAKNQLLPELNLSFIYRFVGVGDHLGTKPSESLIPGNPFFGTNALDELLGGNYQEAAVRLEFLPAPIGMRRELARIRNKQLELIREKKVLEDKELALVNELANEYALLESHFSIAQSQFQQLVQSEEEVRARLAEYEGGQTDINFLLQSQIRRANAQSAYYESIAAYNKSIARVHYLKGTLLSYDNIVLTEGPWSDKAYWDATERARERDAGLKMQYGYSRPEAVRIEGPESNEFTPAPR